MLLINIAKKWTVRQEIMQLILQAPLLSGFLDRQMTPTSSLRWQQLVYFLNRVIFLPAKRQSEGHAVYGVIRSRALFPRSLNTELKIKSVPVHPGKPQAKVIVP